MQLHSTNKLDLYFIFESKNYDCCKTDTELYNLIRDINETIHFIHTCKVNNVRYLV